MEKVTLPKEVAEAMENLLSRGAEDKDIIAYGMARFTTENAGEIYRYAQDNFYGLMSALVNGYQVEQTPEERLREYYDNMLFANGDTYSDVIKHTLDILGIEIDGINA
jgi:hypothetical protein